MALVRNKDWQLVLSNTPNQVVLYHHPSKSLKVAAISPTQSETEAGSICPTCLQPLQPSHSDTTSAPTTTKYFRLLTSLDDEGTSSPHKRHSITAFSSPPPTHSTHHSYQSRGDDITARIDGYYARFFMEVRQLGRGAYASVHLCQHTLNGNLLGLYAVKKVAVGLSSEYLSKVLQEVKLLENLRHPHIVDYHHSWIELATLTQFGPQVPTLYLLMSFANGGSLAQLIQARQGRSSVSVDSEKMNECGATKEELIAQQRRQRKEHKEHQKHQRRASHHERNNNTTTTTASPHRRESDTRSIHYFRTDELIVLFKSIADGLDFLHSKGIMHLDLKPANVLLNWDDSNDTIPRAMISDFGSSFAGAATDASQRTGQTGTMEYTSPEALHVDAEGRFSQERSFKNDIWSLGMILYEMVFFTLPWHTVSGNDYDELSREIMNYRGFDEDAIRLGTLARPSVPIGMLHLLAKMLDRNAASRPLAYKVLEEVERIERVNEEADRKRVFDVFKTQTQKHTSIRSGPLPELARPTILPSSAPAQSEDENAKKERKRAMRRRFDWVVVVAGVLCKLMMIRDNKSIVSVLLVAGLVIADVERKNIVLTLSSTIFTPTNVLGLLMMLLSGGIFTYYTAWVLVTPLLEPTNSIQGYFPDRNWAIRIPAALLLAGFSVVGLFTSYVMYQERQKRRNEGVKRA